MEKNILSYKVQINKIKTNNVTIVTALQKSYVLDEYHKTI